MQSLGFMCDATKTIVGTVERDRCGGAPIFRTVTGVSLGTVLPTGWRECCCGNVLPTPS